MVDERKLEELFRSAVQSAPPASFDEQDVRRASRRITVRRRVAAVGGALVAAGLLVGLGTGTGLFAPREDSQVASPPPTQAPPTSQAPGVLSEPRAGCGAPDRELVTELTGALPEAASGTPVAAGECPTGARAAAVVLQDGAASGKLTVLVGPADQLPAGLATDATRPDGTRQVARPTGSGQLVVVLSEPDADSPTAPHEARLAGVAEQLADRF